MKTSVLGFILSVLFISVVVFMLFGVAGIELTFFNILLTAVVCVGLSLVFSGIMVHRF